MAASPGPPLGGLDFGTYEAELSTGTTTVDASATAELQLSPEPRLYVTCVLGSNRRADLLNAIQLDPDLRLRFKSRRQVADFYASGFQFSGRAARLQGTFSGWLEAGNPRAAPRSVAFVLVNGSAWTRAQSPHGRTQWVECRFGSWLLRLEAVAAIASILKSLRSEGGYRITHRATLSPLGGGTASLPLFREALEGLHYFLSFAAGRWVGPIAPRGLSAQGARVWEVWALPNQSRWRTSRTWCDVEHFELISQVLPGFWALWQQPSWKDPLRRAIHWYVSANQGDGGLEGGIIMSQAALELLGWVVRQHSGAAVSGTTVQAAKAIRDLLSGLNIPIRLPRSLGTLVYRAKKNGGLWKDGPDALTRIRNAIVHAEDRHGVLGMDPRGRYQAWNLGQWYLELVLLGLFGYSGQYANRLSQEYVGDVEDVPWA